eukprot:Skav230439  [mRNA]  locus=scaffold1601:239191:239841:+ [translate_table: standard]
MKAQKQPKKRRGGGGGFRAFLSETTRGQKASAFLWRERAQAYRSLSPEEKAKYKELGALATASHQRGFDAFGGKVRKKAQRAISRARAPAQIADALPQDAATIANSFAIVPTENPEQFVKAKLAKIRHAGVNVRNQVSNAREAAMHDIVGFLNQARLPQCVNDWPNFRPSAPAASDNPGADSKLVSFLPKPSTLPWMEWIPPSDVLAKARQRSGSD